MIKVENLSMSQHQEKCRPNNLNEVTFKNEKGEFALAMHGASGCGKSHL